MRVFQQWALHDDGQKLPEIEMDERSQDMPSREEIDSLILQALVRKLLAKGVLSQEDVRALLADAVASLTSQPRPDVPNRPPAG